jgi:hypothetical protein
VLGTQLRVQNKVYKVDPSTDLEMCKAIVRSTPRPLFACPRHPCCAENCRIGSRRDSAHIPFLLYLGEIFF